MRAPDRLVDTNLIVRYLVQDHKEHSKVASRLFAASDAGRLSLVVLPTVLAESVFVLESFYEHPRNAIADALRLLLLSPGIECSDRNACVEALDRYAQTKLHFVDCLVAAHAVEKAIPIATFDKGISRFSDVTVSVEVGPSVS